MIEQYQTKYETLLPQPWPEGREAPNSAMNEVLKAWSAATIPRTEHPCRKIVFTLISHDQGWGGGPAAEGQYDGSFTWFDVGKEEMSAFKEGKRERSPCALVLTFKAAALEAWEKAPWPQLRLYCSKDAPQANIHKISRLVCSLRTVLPLTVPIPGIPSDDVEDNIADRNFVQAPQPNGHQNSGPSHAPRTRHQFKHELCPTDDVLQKNVVAKPESKTHVITWKYNDNIQPESPEADELHYQGRGKNTGRGDFVSNMKMGDCVTVWAKARFRGWINTVEKVQIDVYWAV